MFTSSVVTIAALASTTLAAPQFGISINGQSLGGLLGFGNSGFGNVGSFGNSYGYNQPAYGPNVVTYCSDVNYRGTCRNAYAPQGQCVNVDTDMNDLTSAMRVPFGLRCTMFADYNCRGGDYPISAPGLSNFIDYNINDAMSSFVCYQS